MSGPDPIYYQPAPANSTAEARTPMSDDIWETQRQRVRELERMALSEPQPPAPAMRVDDYRAECLNDEADIDCGKGQLSAWWQEQVSDLLADRADLLRENARLRGELAHVRAMLGEANAGRQG